MGKLAATKEELQELIKFNTCEGIGKKFDCSAELVRRQLHKLGISISRRKFDPPKDELENLYQSMSCSEIAKHYGVGETVVWGRIKEHNIELKEFVNHRMKPGREFSLEHKKNLSKAHKGKWTGELNPNWKGGVHQKHLAIRATGDYKQWRVAALAAKGNRCEDCGTEQNSMCNCCGVKIRLHVHHVKSFSKHPELRFDPLNAEVLCPKCHTARHN
jgi:transposase